MERLRQERGRPPPLGGSKPSLVARLQKGANILIRVGDEVAVRGVDLAHGRAHDGGKVEERNPVADSPGRDTASTLPEALALQVETGFVLARHRSVEAAWDVPPKRSTQDAALADALRRTPAPEAPRIVDARKDAHAGSLRRGRQAKTVSNPRQDSRVPQQTRQGDNDCDAV